MNKEKALKNQGLEFREDIIKKGGFHMKKNRKIFSILLVLVLAIQLTAIPAVAASTRTVSRTSTKVTTSYTERKLKLTKKASKTYSVVGKSVTYITYSTQGNTSIKTTKKDPDNEL